MGRTEDESFAVFAIEAATPVTHERRPPRPLPLKLIIAVAIIAAIALAFVRVDLDHEQPRVTLRWTGCTLLPQACSRQPLMTFDLEVLGLGLLPFDRVGELSRAPYLPRDGFTTYATNDPTGLVRRKPRVQLALAVRPQPDKATIWDVAARSSHSRAYRERTVDLGDDVTAAVSKAALAEGFTETWVVPAGAGHGAVGLTIAVDGADAPLDGWTDGNVTSVLRQYLGAALPTAPAPSTTEGLWTVPEGCTMTPTTCSNSVAENFVRGSLGVAASVDVATYASPNDPGTYRFTATSVDGRPVPSGTTPRSTGQPVTHLQITIDAGDAPRALVNTQRPGRPPWVIRQQRLGSGEVVLISRDFASGTRSFHEVWVLRPASGEINHGSIAIEITHTAGRSGTGQVGPPPGWTDDNVLALMRLYLGVAG